MLCCFLLSEGIAYGEVEGEGVFELVDIEIASLAGVIRCMDSDSEMIEFP